MRSSSAFAPKIKKIKQIASSQYSNFPWKLSILHTSSIRMVCAGGNRSSARTCRLSGEEHEYTTTDKGYEAT